ncbi:MAG: SDR family oxidoreductase [Alphaproteobacteria bacterium]|jgi:NAD(P)-dependent dehydrogenase (short-subunit alcohol dehydrogenase family)|nr:SDR family oxidoreductase [Alphaproteobacteria bacterium]MBT4017512.1 SDR family oxidoreductase [Alphaproteobacteria bacterium]MBT4964667.1 SDR family oxidoreductase [Alphaproteobacteria bacterium]MBT5161118.1 SDR family oxidoreductase [Alphaproteobacteria bacterium]
MDLHLDGKVALVTGGNRGLGAACAAMLASEGARIFLTARDDEKLTETAQAISGSSGAEVGAMAVDLTKPDAADAVVEAAIKKFGRIDILVNSAGASKGGVFWEVPDQVWQDSFDLKFMATVRMMRAVIPGMRAQGYGRIVSIVGNTGKQPPSTMLPSASANAALLVVTKGLADEVVKDGIIVNAVNPGPTRTERMATILNNIQQSSGRPMDEVEKDFVSNIPMKRMGEPEEIARLVTFLASDMAANLTGISITADGGSTKALA